MRTRARLRATATLVAAGCGAPAGERAAPTTDGAPPVAAAEAEPGDRAGWRARLRWSEDCERGFALVDGRGTGVEAYPLGDGRRLVQVACAPGAYQGTYVYFVAPGAPSAPLEFPDVAEAGDGDGRLSSERTTEVVGLPSFDTTDARLRVLRRFRGVGDCGVLLTYAFPGGVPTLAELRGKLACDGQAPPPESWPVLTPPPRS